MKFNNEKRSNNVLQIRAGLAEGKEGHCLSRQIINGVRLWFDCWEAHTHTQEANHYHPTPWLKKWALVETGTFIQSSLRGDMALCLPAEWPTAAASCNHVPVTMDDLSGRVLHSWMAAGEKKKWKKKLLQIAHGLHHQHALIAFKNSCEMNGHPLPNPD